MKITGVETFPIEVPPPHKGGKVWLFRHLVRVLVRRALEEAAGRGGAA